MSKTIIKTATVRVSLSYNYSVFEVSAQLENETGISISDINIARVDCQELASTAVSQYKTSNNGNPKEEIKKVENMVSKLKKEFGTEEPKQEAQPTAEEIAKVESMPLYEGKGIAGNMGTTNKKIKK